MDYQLLPYRISLALLTDLYELTMAYGYWKNGVADREAVFNLFFRKNPFKGGYTLCAGLAAAMDLLEQFRFDEEDLAYMAGLLGRDGKPLFEPAFLEYLRDLRLECDIDAIPEGTVVFPQEPLVRVKGPILQAQILETCLLNQINFASLIATKSARVCLAARGEPVLEFGLRRAQGADGGLTAGRAAYIGGCAATSDVLAGRLYGIPVAGTMAHSWVMSFPSEQESFEAFARAMPNNSVLLVDTYDTLQGVEHAIPVARWLREQGHELSGIRLDSGDLAGLSEGVRRRLDAAGFPDVRILASGDLDEERIEQLKQQGAPITMWGVGTQLVTGGTEAALGGVYKLTAVRDGAQWQYRLKISDQPDKTTNPGLLRARRYRNAEGQSIADVIYDEAEDLSGGVTIVDPRDPTRRRCLSGETACEELLVPVFRGGRRVYATPLLTAIRDRAAAQLAAFPEGYKRLKGPDSYPVGLSQGLYDLKTAMIEAYRGHAREAASDTSRSVPARPDDERRRTTMAKTRREQRNGPTHLPSGGDTPARTEPVPLAEEEPTTVREDEQEVHDLGFMIDDHEDRRGRLLAPWQRLETLDTDQSLETDPTGPLPEEGQVLRREGIPAAWHPAELSVENLDAEEEEGEFAEVNRLVIDPDTEGLPPAAGAEEDRAADLDQDETPETVDLRGHARGITTGFGSSLPQDIGPEGFSVEDNPLLVAVAEREYPISTEALSEEARGRRDVDEMGSEAELERLADRGARLEERRSE